MLALLPAAWSAHLRVAQDGAGDGDALLLAAAQVVALLTDNRVVPACRKCTWEQGINRTRRQPPPHVGRAEKCCGQCCVHNPKEEPRPTRWPAGPPPSPTAPHPTRPPHIPVGQLGDEAVCVGGHGCLHHQLHACPAGQGNVVEDGRGKEGGGLADQANLRGEWAGQGSQVGGRAGG